MSPTISDPTNRNSNCIDAEVVADRRSKRGAEPLIVKDICKEADQFEQKPRNVCTNRANDDRHQHHGDDTE